MLDAVTKRRIDTCRNILVGKVPDPKSQVEQITIALIYKFMDDMDAEAEELGGKRTFFAGPYGKYGWSKIMAPGLGGFDVWALYSEGIQKMNQNPGVPGLFRDIFKNAYLPYRDPETLRLFLKEIDGFTYDHSERLGDAFEYLLSVMDSQGDAGQFRTPRHIIDFMVELIDPKKGDKILDPACGTAGFLISAWKHIRKANTSDPSRGASGDLLTPDERTRLADNTRGYDISPDMVRLALVNLYLHGFKNPQIEEYDTLTSEDFWTETADVILANPPFMSPKGGIKPHHRFTVKAKRSEVLFVDYIAERLNPGGRAAVIVPEGIIFQSGKAYKQLRAMLVNEYLAAVISLPAGVFNPYSGVKTSILLLDKRLAKKTDAVLFAKIEHDGYDLGAQRRPTGKSDLPEAAKQIEAWLSAARNGGAFDPSAFPGVLLVERKRIGANGEWNLSGERYRDVITTKSKYPLIALGEVCEVKGGKRLPRGAQFANVPTSHPYIRVSDFRNQTVVVSNLKFISKDIRNQISRYTISSSDVYISIAGTIGLMGTIPDSLDGANLTENAAKLIIKPSALDKRFLSVVGNTDVVQRQVRLLTHAVGVPKLALERIKLLTIPLPPLEVQREIVAEIEGYQQIIDGARQVVESYRPRIPIDPEWPVVELGEVCTINPRKSEIGDLDGSTIVSFVPMADINENTPWFEPNETKKLAEVTTSYTYFRDNDVLVAKVTPCFENGKAGIARNLVNGIGFGSSEFYVLRSNGRTLPEWVFTCVTSPAFRELATARMTGTGGLQRVPRAVVEGYQVPLPDLDTQRGIVAQIEQEQRLVDTNKALIRLFEGKIKAAIDRVWGEAE